MALGAIFPPHEAYMVAPQLPLHQTDKSDKERPTPDFCVLSLFKGALIPVEGPPIVT